MTRGENGAFPHTQFPSMFQFIGDGLTQLF